MLLYSNQDDARVALQLTGSVLFSKKALLYAGSVACGTFIMQCFVHFSEDNLQPKLAHTYAMSTLGVIVSFSTIFRNNLAWQRYWEGLSQAHYMYSKWEDAFAQFAVFCRVTIEAAAKELGNPSAVTKVDRVQAEFAHVLSLFDLLSALAADRIAHGDTEIMDFQHASGKAGWHMHVMTHKDLAKQVDITGASALPRFDEATFDLSASVGEGTLAWKPGFGVTRVPTTEEKVVLEKSDKRPSVVMTWIIASISRIAKDLIVPPPIVSRIYQELSNGMAGFEACCKISNTPFPFAYAQLQIFLIFVFTVMLPVYVACFTQSFIIGPLLSFIIFGSIFGINEVAEDMERPFGRDLNDIVLHDFHAHFVHLLEEMGPILDVDGLMHAARYQAHEERMSDESPNASTIASTVVSATKSMTRPNLVKAALFREPPSAQGGVKELRPKGVANWLGEDALSPSPASERAPKQAADVTPAQSPRDAFTL